MSKSAAMNVDHEEEEFFEPAEPDSTLSSSDPTFALNKSPQIVNNSKTPLVDEQVTKGVESPTLDIHRRSTKDDAKALLDSVVTSRATSSSGWNAWGSWTSTLSQVVNVASTTIAQQADKIYEVGYS